MTNKISLLAYQDLCQTAYKTKLRVKSIRKRHSEELIAALGGHSTMAAATAAGFTTYSSLCKENIEEIFPYAEFTWRENFPKARARLKTLRPDIDSTDTDLLFNELESRLNDWDNPDFSFKKRMFYILNSQYIKHENEFDSLALLNSFDLDHCKALAQSDQFRDGLYRSLRNPSGYMLKYLGFEGDEWVFPTYIMDYVSSRFPSMDLKLYAINIDILANIMKWFATDDFEYMYPNL